MAELGLGTMNFGRAGWGCDARVADALVGRFLDAGGTHLDTADVYGDGASEQILGRAIAGRRDAVLLCTKAGWPTGGPADRGTGAHLLRALDASLARLRTDRVDVFYAHVWDQDTALEETAAALGAIVRAGKARALGVCNHTGWQLAEVAAAVRAAGARLSWLQTMHALTAREVEWDSLVVARRLGLRVVAWGALASGLLSGKYGEQAPPPGARLCVDAKTPRALRARVWTERNLALVDVVVQEARALGRSAASLATAWSLGHAGLDVVLAGPRDLAQLEELLACGASLPGEVRARLDRASAPAVPFPHDEAEAVAAVLRD